MSVKANWYVITGGPSSGKTTTVNLLRNRGYVTTIEHARHYIDTQRITGRSVKDIRSNQREFQRSVIDMQIEQEAALDRHALTFLDRALPDALAYYRMLAIAPDPDYLSQLQRTTYRGIFVLDLLPLAPDYARNEDRAGQVAIHDLLSTAYRELGYDPLPVPVLPAESRVDFILAHL